MENELASLSESIGSFAQLSSSAKEASQYMASIQEELHKLNTWLFELESFVKPGIRDLHEAMREQASQLKATLL
jgi:predicted S18 family serine protease